MPSHIRRAVGDHAHDDRRAQSVNLLRKTAAVTVTAAVLATLPTVAAAHEGSHPFENCTAAYEAGYESIPEGDEHYGTHLDRDEDGIGCDQPPSDFVPADTDTGSEDSGADDAANEASGDEASGQENTELAETGGDDTTPYLAAGGAAVLLAGAGVLVTLRRRRGAQQ